MSQRKRLSAKRAISTMVRRIVREFDPDQVILFGSHAAGNARDDSDIDLLVVMPTRKSKRESALRVRLALQDVVFPKDVVVTTPEEFSWRKDITGTIECIAVRHGKSLYARS